MKKKILHSALLIVFVLISSCSGYKPIFSSSNINFEISQYSLEGDKKLSNKIYSQLYNLTKSNKNDLSRQSIDININTNKNKEATAKNSAGKILEYKITLNINVSISNFLTNDKILNKKFTTFSSYKVQDQYSETLKLENKTIENLLNKIYQDLIISISENL